MDITGLDVGAIVTSLGTFIKCMHSDRKAEATKKGIDERFAVLETHASFVDKRLDDGDAAFRNFDAKQDRTNELLNQLIGEVRASRR